MLDIILNECEFTIAMCFWNLLIAKEKTNNIRERERGRENEPREWKRETERDVQTMLKTKLASIHMFALKKMEETHIPN